MQSSVPEQIQQILEDLKRIKFGSLEIIVHDGEIVQIEKKEKIRFEKTKQTNCMN